jgi:hypothetical protein
VAVNEFGVWSSDGNVVFNIKPSAALTISTGPAWSRAQDLAQYVRTETDQSAVATFGERYVFARLRQTQLSLTTRVSFVMTPRASLQVFMQPLLATGGYGHFKELASPRSFTFLEYGTDGTSIAYDPLARQYAVAPTGDAPGPAFSFENPDFNFKSLRLNAVFRWEVRPGSTLYVVWTQIREDLSRPGEFHVARDAATLFGAPPNDIVLVKMAYWLGR